MLYYLHGYQSSPQSTKGLLFKETLHANPVTYRTGAPEDLIISDCLSRISEAIKDDPEVILIGSSLGGFLAASLALTHTTIKQLILLNPAIIPPETDLLTVPDMPQHILREMKDPRLFTQKITAAITILRGTHDEIVPDEWVLCFAQAQQATIQLFDDDHRFSKNLEKLPDIISQLLHR